MNTPLYMFVKFDQILPSITIDIQHLSQKTSNIQSEKNEKKNNKKFGDYKYLIVPLRRF